MSDNKNFKLNKPTFTNQSKINIISVMVFQYYTFCILFYNLYLFQKKKCISKYQFPVFCLERRAEKWIIESNMYFEIFLARCLRMYHILVFLASGHVYFFMLFEQEQHKSYCAFLK